MPLWRVVPGAASALALKIFAHKGWSVCCEAADGLQAIQEAERCKPDLIIIDLAMPQVNGLSAARRISELLPGVPIRFTTCPLSEVIAEISLYTHNPAPWVSE